MTLVQHFFDPATYTLSYIIYDQDTKDAFVIDPVLDFQPESGKVETKSIDKLKHFISQNQLNLHLIIETHAHADHLSGAVKLKEEFPKAQIAVGKNIDKVQKTFKSIFNLKDLNIDGSQFDILLNEQEEVTFGSLSIKTLFTPGHTPACSSYLINGHLFTGDTLFMPDYGTGRCDFPAGSAEDLYDSIVGKIYTLDPKIEYYTGHDYQPGGRALRYKATIEESMRENIQLKAGVSKEEFVKFRNDRDAQLSVPRLLYPSIQVNVDAGKMPKSEENGKKYIKIPLEDGE